MRNQNILLTFTNVINKNNRTMESRIIAMGWWNDSLTSDDKGSFAHKYYERPWQTLTGREIEQIYKHEVSGELIDYIIVDENYQLLYIGKSETEKQMSSRIQEYLELSGGAKLYVGKTKKLEQIVV